MDNEYFMTEAIKEARKAFKNDEVPVGCVIVLDDKIIARAHNLKLKKSNALYHAEIVCIEKALKKIKNTYLENCKLYVTLEPCPMCAGAIIQTRIKEVYFAAHDVKGGAMGSVINLFDHNFQNPKVKYKGGILEVEARVMLQEFFKKLREKKKSVESN